MSLETAWSEPAQGVLVRQSRAYWMNSTVLLRDGHAVVVDAGVLPSEMREIAARVAEGAPRFENVALVFTHPHWDHVLARPWFPAATTVAHAGFADEADAADIEAKAKRWIEGAGEPWPRPFAAFTPDLVVRGTASLPLGPFQLVSHDVPGHSASQIALFEPASGTFLAADMLSDIEIPWLAAPAWVYLATLKALQVVFEHEEVRALVPGHGPIAYGRHDAYRRLLRDFDYLTRLDGAVREVHARGGTLEEAQAACAGMDYTGRDAAYAMNDVHARNVRFTWEGLVG